MQFLSAKEDKTMSANAVRQARYAERMREKGMKRLTLWVTPEQEQFIRACILEPQRRQRERENQ